MVLRWATIYRELLQFPHRLRQFLEASPSSARTQLPHLIHCYCGKAGERGNGGEMCTIILALCRATTHGELLEFPHRLRQLLVACPSSARRQLPHLIHHWCLKADPRWNCGELCTIVSAPGRATTHRELLEFPHRLRQLLEAAPSSARRQLPHLIRCWCG